MVDLEGSWSSSGTLTATGGGSLVLNGAWSNSGAVSATSGGTVNLQGAWSDSVGATLTGGTLNLQGSGTLTAASIMADAASTVNFIGTVSMGGGALALPGAGRSGPRRGTPATSPRRVGPR